MNTGLGKVKFKEKLERQRSVKMEGSQPCWDVALDSGQWDQESVGV